MKLTLEINMDGEAFGDSDTERKYEAARILHRAAVTLVQYSLEAGIQRSLHDHNVRLVGHFIVTDKDSA